jgi:hypothetical protein
MAQQASTRKSRFAGKKDLRLLKELLPKVEATCSTDAKATDVVGHLCDFYNDVLTGGFCPHAPNLFRWGGNGTGKVISLWMVVRSAGTLQPSDDHMLSSISLHERS